jgi:hypothetical protein
VGANQPKSASINPTLAVSAASPALRAVYLRHAPSIQGLMLAVPLPCLAPDDRTGMSTSL